MMSRLASALASALTTRLTALVAAALALTIAVPAAHATAAPRLAVDPDAVTTLEIHKFEQPDVAGSPANGLPQDTTGLVPLPGATFTATRVPGIDLTTNSGQAAAAALTIHAAEALVAALPADASGTTDAAGNATLAPLGVGLYYVHETVVPLGYAPSAPFLVMLPFTDPIDRDSWLTTVHVYPKNANAAVTLDVIDESAVVLGDAVRWVSRSSIPNTHLLDGYRVAHQLDSQLELVGASQLASSVMVSLVCSDGNPCTHASAHLSEGIDYLISYDGAARQLRVDFTADGLRKLEQVVGDDSGAQVVIAYDAIVLADGVMNNEATLYASRYAIDNDLGVPAVATTKWGPLSVVVHEQGNSANPIVGATFMLYLSEQDAIDRKNPVTINGVSEWQTDAQGRLTIEGLRFSGFANGLDRDSADPLYRYYWVVPTSTPQGWQWVDQRPLAGSVNSAIEFQTLVFNMRRSADLSITGAQLGGIGLLAGVLLIGSAIAFVARRRHHAITSLAE